MLRPGTRSKWATFPVTRVRSCAFAVAAICMSMSANGVPQLCKTKEQEVSVFEFGSNILFPLIQPFHRSLPIRHAIYLAPSTLSPSYPPPSRPGDALVPGPSARAAGLADATSHARIQHQLFDILSSQVSFAFRVRLANSNKERLRNHGATGHDLPPGDHPNTATLPLFVAHAALYKKLCSAFLR